MFLRVLPEARFEIVQLPGGTKSTVSYDRMTLAAKATEFPISDEPVGIPQSSDDESEAEPPRAPSPSPRRSPRRQVHFSSPPKTTTTDPLLGDQDQFDHLVKHNPVAHRTRSRLRKAVATISPMLDRHAQIRDKARDWLSNALALPCFIRLATATACGGPTGPHGLDI